MANDKKYEIPDTLIKRVPNFMNISKFSMVSVQDIPYGVKVRDLLEFLKTCNPDAICVGDYDCW